MSWASLWPREPSAARPWNAWNSNSNFPTVSPLAERRKTLMTYRIRNISIAIALALVAALLTSFYVTNYQRDVRKAETNVPVYVAKVDIPAGTSGADVVRSGMLNKTEIVRRGVVPGRDLESGTARDARRHRADLRRRAGVDAPFRDPFGARNSRSADGPAARNRRTGRGGAATRRNGEGRRSRRCRRHVHVSRRFADPLQPDHPPRRPRPEGARSGRAPPRRSTRLERARSRPRSQSPTFRSRSCTGR